MPVETKAIELVESEANGLMEVHVTGKLEKADYEAFVPEVEQFIRDNGKIRMLVGLHDFHGWTAGALWEDVKFDAKHFNDVERLAIVGETKWESGMAKFCKAFTTASVQFFPHEEIENARAWLQE